MQSQDTQIYSLPVLAREFLTEVAGSVERKKKNLFSAQGLQVFLLYIRAQGHVPTHHASGAITVQTLVGRARFDAEGQSHDMPSGSIISLAPGIPHELWAGEESVLLVSHAMGAE